MMEEEGKKTWQEDEERKGKGRKLRKIKKGKMEKEKTLKMEQRSEEDGE